MVIEMFIIEQVLDVGGQQGERRKWITLFDGVTAVLFMMDTGSFDQTLREDSKTSRLLESLKVFYQTITTRYVPNVHLYFCTSALGGMGRVGYK